jgi:hypothetical protein
MFGSRGGFTSLPILGIIFSKIFCPSALAEYTIRSKLIPANTGNGWTNPTPHFLGDFL